MQREARCREQWPTKRRIDSPASCPQGAADRGLDSRQARGRGAGHVAVHAATRRSDVGKGVEERPGQCRRSSGPQRAEPGRGRRACRRGADVQACSPACPRHGLYGQEADVAHPYQGGGHVRRGPEARPASKSSVQSKSSNPDEDSVSTEPTRRYIWVRKSIRSDSVPASWIGWKSRWYASKQEFSESAAGRSEAAQLRRRKVQFAGIPKVEIERTRDEVKVILFTARPGIIIGRKGQEVERLQTSCRSWSAAGSTSRSRKSPGPKSRPNWWPKTSPSSCPSGPVSAADDEAGDGQTMEAGAKGIKIQLAGRLGGSEMARREKQIAGSIPLSTLRAKIDYGFTEAKTAQGHIGVQVWVNQGMYEEDSHGADAQEGQAPKKPKRTYKR